MDAPKISRRAAIAAALAATQAIALAGCGTKPDDDASSPTAPTATAAPAPTPSSATSARATLSDDEGQSFVERTLAKMTLGQKVAQLFVVTPEQLTGVAVATTCGKATAKALAEYPFGGLCYFSQNITGSHQLRDLLSDTRKACEKVGAGVPPFLAVDEEGGKLVARVASSGLFDVKRFPNMAKVGATGDERYAAKVGGAIGAYLRDIGFDVDFAPVADVLTNPANTVIGERSFGSDPDLVARMVASEVGAMLETGTLPCAKHFPGHGDTAGDSHTGAVCATRTREQIEGCELVPFRAAIDAGCPMVMVGHIETPNFAADGLPASLSPTMIGEVLRKQLGFDGLVVSDSFAMGAITQHFSAAEAATRFVAAGGDIILMPEDLPSAYQGLLDAVEKGKVSEKRLEESVTRVLATKRAAGILS